MAKTPNSKSGLPLKPTSRSITDYFFQKSIPPPEATSLASNSSSPSISSSPVEKSIISTPSKLSSKLNSNNNNNNNNASTSNSAAIASSSGSGLSRNQIMKDKEIIEVDKKKEDAIDIDEEEEEEKEMVKQDNAIRSKSASRSSTVSPPKSNSNSKSLPIPELKEVVEEEEFDSDEPLPIPTLSSPQKLLERRNTPRKLMNNSPSASKLTSPSKSQQLQTPVDSSSPTIIVDPTPKSLDKGKGRAISPKPESESEDEFEEVEAFSLRQSTPSPSPPPLTITEEEELSPFTDKSPQLSPEPSIIPLSPTPVTATIASSRSSTVVCSPFPLTTPILASPARSTRSTRSSSYTFRTARESQAQASPSNSSPSKSNLYKTTLSNYGSPSKSSPLKATPSQSSPLRPSQATPSKSISKPSPFNSFIPPPALEISQPTSERADSYLRSPSGSPSSNLPPSPSSSPSKEFRKHNRRPHTFSLEIEVPNYSRSSRRTSISIRNGRSQSVMSSRLSPVKQERYTELEDEDEDEDMNEVEDEDEDEDMNEVEEEEELSPREARRRKRIPSPARSDNSDSDSDAEMNAALERAAARRATGTAIVTSSTTIALALTSSTNTPTSPTEIRRSERVFTAAEKGKGKAVISSGGGGGNFGGSGIGAKGKLGIAALVKESNAAAKKGITLMDQARALLDAADDSDLLNSDDDSDESRSSTPLHTLSSAKFDSMMDAAARLADEDEYVRSPEKKQARERANHMASILREDVDREKGLVKERDPSEIVRAFWKNEVVLIDELKEEEIMEEGWKADVLKGIQAGCENVDKFPSPILVFSRLSTLGSIQDQKDVAKTLLSLICHPSTITILAIKAIQLLNRQIRHFAKSQSLTTLDSLFTLSQFTDELKKLGAKAGLLDEFSADNESAELMGVDQIEETQEKEEEEADLDMKDELDSEQRSTGVIRWMRVVKDLSDASRLEESMIVALMILSVRLAIDINAASTRSSIGQTLESLISNPALENLEARAHIYRSLYSVYKGANPKVKLEVLRSLPYRTKTGKLIRKWLAVGLLREFTEPLDITLFSNPPSLTIIKAIVELPLTGPFNILPDMDDIDLYNNGLMYTIALTDLCDELHQASETKRMKAVRNVDELYIAVGSVESRIRTYVKSGNPDRNRAKNALLRLSHSLNYQRKIADGRSNTNVIDGLENDRPNNINGNGNSKKSKLGPPEIGQQRLMFSVVAKKEVEVIPEVEEEVVAEEKEEVQEVEDVAMEVEDVVVSEEKQLGIEQ